MLKDFRSYQMALELYKKCVLIKAKAYLKDQLERGSGPCLRFFGFSLGFGVLLF